MKLTGHQLAVMDGGHFHAVPQGEGTTLCGIPPVVELVDDPDLDLPIRVACDCGRPHCQFPVTCPTCLLVAQGKAA